MKITILKALCCSIILTTGSCLAELRGTSFFSPRSQGTNTARELVGWHRFINKPSPHDWYGACSITPEYLRSFRARRLAEYFFGTNNLNISGSEVTTRTSCDLLADYFGLSPKFSSNVYITPKMQTFLTDFGVYFGCNSWYFRAHTPFVWTENSLCLNELIKDNGLATPFPAHYMTSAALEAPFSSWCQAMKGCKDWGNTAGLQAGRICGSRSAHAFADINCALGWNAVTSEYGHAGFALHTVIPTGNRPCSTFLFEPVIGNGKHWELGLGFDGSGIIWEKDGNQQLEFLVEMRATHLFKACQRRSFDFVCTTSYQQDTANTNFLTGFASRYILLKEFDTDGTYANKLHPAINKTTLRCNVDACIQFDGTFAFGYQYEGFGFDIGYNAWIRSRENIHNVECFQENKFGIKGVQNATGDNTQSKATIYGNILSATEPDRSTKQARLADAQSPIFISMSNLNLESAAAPCQFTHKIFWNFSHAWENRERVPYLGCGGEVEFEGYRPKNVQPNKPSMAQWGLWLKGGFAF
jgi:hypothetical protein